MEYIENKTFDEINVGDSASLARTLTRDDINLFAVMSGDINPAHVDEEYAKSDMFHKIIAHGMWGGSLISTLLGTKLPGPGTIYLGQTLRFKRPVTLGDTITVTITVTARDEKKHRITFDCQCVNQYGEVVISGSAEVIAPTEKVRRPRVVLPEVHIHEHGTKLQQLITLAKGLEPIHMAVVHPVDRNSLMGAIKASEANLIIPTFIGPESRIHAIAESEDIDLSPYTLISTEHSHESAAKAIDMARAGEVESLMRGSLRIGELMHEVLAKDTGLRTGRRLSHVFARDIPTYPKLLFITDTVINIDPDLEDKRDIVQNAIDLAVVLGIENPKVAILSAVETVTPKIRSTIEAAALCKMAECRQITGGLVGGPLAFDTAVSEEVAKSKNIVSPVAGKADILVVPDLESGNMLIKQLESLAEAQSAGIVLGGRVPIVLTRPEDSSLSRIASCAIALLLVRHKRGAKP